jgi:glycosyltransferase involved in cell wall biosynthesis/Tfp pilus assembly protein PilF
MEASEVTKPQVALLFGTLPTIEEIDQFRLISEVYDVCVISSESICSYIGQNSFFNNLKCITLPDYDENPTYLPGLETVLSKFDLVIVKERLGLYGYQAVKAKWRSNFRLVVWCDNMTAFPGDDIQQMRTIRKELVNAADAFIVQTEGTRAALNIEGISNDKIVSFVPWVERRLKRSPKNKAKALEILGLMDGDFVIAHMGQVEWEEGLFELLQGAKLAIAKDAALNRRLRIVVYGIGQLSPYLHERVIALGMEKRVKYVAPSRDAQDTVLAASDALYFGTMTSRDRVDGDPFRLLPAMINEVPVLASRSRLAEEIVGKHRIDFCAGSSESIADAICKVANAAAVRADVVKKNAATIEQRFTKQKAKDSIEGMLAQFKAATPSVDPMAIDHQILEIETKIRSKEYIQAIDMIESVFKLPTLPLHHKSNLYRLIGDCSAKLGDGEQAKKAYSQSLEIDPYSAKCFIGLGTIALMRQSNDIAVLHFQRAVGLAPHDEMANLGLGLAFQGLNELEESNKWVAKALEINTDNTPALFTIVKLAYDRNQFKDAETSLRRYLELKPEDMNMTFSLAGILFKTNRYQEAESLAAKMITANPEDNRAAALIAQIHRSDAATSGAKA